MESVKNKLQSATAFYRKLPAAAIWQKTILAFQALVGMITCDVGRAAFIRGNPNLDCCGTTGKIAAKLPVLALFLQNIVFLLILQNIVFLLISYLSLNFFYLLSTIP
ncbi:hypothetical protein [Neisseria musculi]|uniref:hypothetical protein n=1 Tax=Neisseria musculi TaxID=1815583 RepID=UPI00164B7987|nr:hypothetical protein [Neisseria musculi]